MIKTYSELIALPTYELRYRYLKLDGRVGEETFGSKRWINQTFYRSAEWLKFRDKIIVRDYGCDLAADGFTIYGPIIIHHINPITCEDILRLDPRVLDPENAVCVKPSTHNAIHYGDESLLVTAPPERTKNDVCPWRR